MVRHRDERAPVQAGAAGKGNVEIINVKSAQVLDMLLYGDPGILPAYHMNKKHWITILLESGFAEKELRDLLMESYRLTQRRKKRVPSKQLSSRSVLPVQHFLIQYSG